MKKLGSDFAIERYGLAVRLVNEDDAEFIVSLRNDPLKSRFIGKTSSKIADQINWIREYKNRESIGNDYYFIYEYCGKRAGVNRIYNINSDSFIHGSWIFSNDVPPFCSLAAAIIAREIAFEQLSLKIENDTAGIHESNTGVLKFAEFMGEIFDGERIDSEMGCFKIGHITKEDFYKNHDKILRLFPKKVTQK